MRLCLVIVLVFYMSTHVRLMRCDQYVSKRSSRDFAICKVPAKISYLLTEEQASSTAGSKYP